MTNQSPDESHTENIYDNRSVNNDVSFNVEANVDEDLNLTNQSFSTSQLTYDALPLSTYDMLSTNNYVKMEIELYHNHD